MGELLAKFIALPRASKIALLLAFTLVGMFLCLLYFRYESEVHRRQAEAAQRNANMAQDKADALKILIESNTVTAQEVQRAKELANQLQTNSNISGNNYNTAVNRQSNTYSNAIDDNKYCSVFPNDDTCAEWRAKYNIPLKER